MFLTSVKSLQVYLTSVAVTVFILPALFITLCHVVMVVRIWQAAANTEQVLTVPLSHSSPVKRLRRAFDHICHEPSAHQANNDSTSSPCHMAGFRGATPIKIKTSPGCIPRARIKTVKMTLVIVSVYIICWCPYMIYNLLITYRVIGPHTPRLMAVSPLIQSCHQKPNLISLFQNNADISTTSLSREMPSAPGDFEFLHESGCLLDVQCPYDNNRTPKKSSKVSEGSSARAQAMMAYTIRKLTSGKLSQLTNRFCAAFSKVVQRHHRRWKCNSRNRVWHDRPDSKEEMMMMKKKTRQNERHFNQPSNRTASNSNQKESEKTSVSVNVEVSQMDSILPSQQNL
ncbi:unnamed protein product [Hydatigera taeniaeformis]|uniref:G_PROTEIN_RECEP_F1_2 domain-containing protein n=1 Tax=Hydatigena taeniaeformis TaxID=6205 RepID=A0A0R3X7B7_HYDTA|nr:unnamed protein product [Hydatigera taeniaeformis]